MLIVLVAIVERGGTTKVHPGGDASAVIGVGGSVLLVIIIGGSATADGVGVDVARIPTIGGDVTIL